MESDLASMNSDVHAAKQRQSKRMSLACEKCRVLKVKCIRLEEGQPCTKCARSQSQCIVPESKRPPRPPQRKTPRLVDLESKLTYILGRLDAPANVANSITPSSKPSAIAEYVENQSQVHLTTEGIGQERLTDNFIETFRPSKNLNATEMAWELSDSVENAWITDLGLSSSVLQHHLDNFRGIKSYFPFVLLPEGMRATSMAEDRPFLLLAVVASSSSKYPHLQNALIGKIKEIISHRVVIADQRTADVLDQRTGTHLQGSPSSSQQPGQSELCSREACHGYHAVKIRIHEMGLVYQYGQRRPLFSRGSKDSEMPSAPPMVIDNLVKCVSSTKEYLDNFLAIPTKEYSVLPIAIWYQVILALFVLYRLSVGLSEVPEWNTDIAQVTVDLEVYLTLLTSRLKSIQPDGLSQSSCLFAMFPKIMESVKASYTSAKGHPAPVRDGIRAHQNFDEPGGKAFSGRENGQSRCPGFQNLNRNPSIAPGPISSTDHCAQLSSIAVEIEGIENDMLWSDLLINNALYDIPST
ncbi:Zn(II)2Cys6 transcription factor domain-containing protein [Aspergillus tanneri]|uniref:Zn(2)-C6 fungal-type domain-containing protein n=1 Tax=Aspergillus tanneri TaxID=1220188 RepID=A0A5M9MI07_9EURO|nr:uncharacterized protein ATNIH1004_009175 [Aspergillus tanneri]KAA8644964.1 hypothetical protein ATNIH1004_009175 [Aspergillus tanneri]